MHRRTLAALVVALATTLASVPAQEIQRDGVTLPSPVRTVKAIYTPAAMDAGIEGRVLLSVVVLEDGKVGEVTVTESLDMEYGLDTQAVEAAKQWLFKPGTKEGKPVAVQVTLEMMFRLK